MNGNLKALLASVDGFEFEELIDWALFHSHYGPDIATIESHKEFATRYNKTATSKVHDDDRGVDRFVTITTGDVFAVQAKHYPDTKIGVGPIQKLREDATLFGGVTKLMLVTSGPGMTAKAWDQAQAKNPVVLNHHRAWLEQISGWPATLTEIRDDLKAIRAGGKGVLYEQPYNLREHQTEALGDVRDAFDAGHKEVQLHSACGTGKTVTAHAVHAAVGAKLTAFFVPTINLVDQSIKSWARQGGNVGIEFLAVCSDPSVGKKNGGAASEDDDFVFLARDLNVPVTTDPSVISEWMAKASFSKKPHVIVSTYASSAVVAEAQRKHGAPALDFVFADEAHSLAGTISTTSDGELIKRRGDNSVIAKRRLYATATPRVLTNKAAVSAAGVIDQMHGVGSIFGPVAHKLSFGNAIERGILVDYRISVLAVRTEDERLAIYNRDFVTSRGGEAIDAGMLATLEAIRQLRAKGLTRIVTYHHRTRDVKRLAELVNNDPELGRAEVIVSGTSATQREDILNLMRDSTKQDGLVITNARCLTEGADLPNLDAVIFADPKNSVAEIAQALGRALRTHEGKKLGHIVIPVPISGRAWETGNLDDSERKTVESENRAYKQIFAVLAAMEQHDEMVAETMIALRNGLGPRAVRRSNTEVSTRGPLAVETWDDNTDEPDSDLSTIIPGLNMIVDAPGMADTLRDQLARNIRLATVNIGTRARNRSTTEVIVGGFVKAGADETIADAYEHLEDPVSWRAKRDAAHEAHAPKNS